MGQSRNTVLGNPNKGKSDQIHADKFKEKKKHSISLFFTFSIHLLCTGSGHNVSKIVDL